MNASVDPLPLNLRTTTFEALKNSEVEMHDATPRPIPGMIDIRRLAISLLHDCFEDECAHLELRCIRDDQAPRFEALKESHPDIYRDFMAARSGPHEVLLRNRRRRVDVLTALVEGNQDRLRTLGGM